MPTTVRVWAPAKVNLTLEVLRRRPDGYHEVATILQAVDLWDELVFMEAPQLSLRCDTPELEGPDNLVLRAAHLLLAVARRSRGAAMYLRKGIPVAAGLGGGSSDAAAALLGLNRLWDLGLSEDRLCALASQLGSDVPFFLNGGTALATGRGERVTSLPPLVPIWLVLVFPPLGLPRKTATLYGALDPADFGNGQTTARVEVLLRQGGTLLPEHLLNTFEHVAYRVFPGLESYAQAMREAGAVKVHLAGSGPTLLCLVVDEEAGRTLVERLAARGIRAKCVQTIGEGLRTQLEQGSPEARE